MPGFSVLDILKNIRSHPERVRLRGLRRGMSRASGAEAVVGFGGVLDSGRLIHGGAVKLLSLREGFPCDDLVCNVLYLVSSSQPAFPEELVAQCQKLRIRFVWNQNGVGYPAWAGGRTEMHNRPMRNLRNRADFVIYQSRFCQRSAEKFLDAATQPSRVLLNPVNVEKFSPAPEDRRAGPLRLLAMGTQNYPERVLRLLDALEILRAGGLEATLTVAGNLLWKNGEAQVAEKVRSQGLVGVVHRRTAFNREEAVDLYRSHDLLLHPKAMDPCPTVVAEALACGLPVVAAASGGLPEMVSPACSRLIPVPEDWETLRTPTGNEIADAVSDLLPQLDEASQSARARAVEVFSQQPWLAAHAEIFSNLLRN